MPPSAMASKTTLAWLRPACGRASVLFSIITPVTGRWLTDGSTGRPLSVEATVDGCLEAFLTAFFVGWALARGWEVWCVRARPTPEVTNKTTTAAVIHSFLPGGQCSARR